MDTTFDRRRNEKGAQPATGTDEYREGIRQLIDGEVKKVLDEEMRKATQELIEEQRKAVRQIIEEHKTAIRQVVEEEKKTIWEKAEALRNSMLRLGL
jgi:ATP-dependent Zn protease